ncbi:hypothetical protein A0O00_16080 [Proteus mirabilis]|nr:hypothetical protein A0O00_16080 [Proteus mirabilis]
MIIIFTFFMSVIVIFVCLNDKITCNVKKSIHIFNKKGKNVMISLHKVLVIEFVVINQYIKNIKTKQKKCD